MRKLSVGYLVDDGYQPGLIYDVIEKSKSAEHYSIDYLIVQTFAEDKNLLKRVYGLFKKREFLRFVAGFCFKAILALEGRIFVRDPKLKSAFDMHQLDTFHVPRIRVRPLKSTSGLVYRYREEDLETIKGLNVDVLLNGQSGTFRGGILTVCEFGIISFHHGNDDVNRGGPPGFWEVFNQEPSTGFVIQRLPDELDGGDALMKGSIPTKPLMPKILRKSTRSQVSLCIGFLKIWARQGFYPKLCLSRLMHINSTRCPHYMLLHYIKSKRSLL